MKFKLINLTTFLFLISPLLLTAGGFNEATCYPTFDKANRMLDDATTQIHAGNYAKATNMLDGASEFLNASTGVTKDDMIGNGCSITPYWQYLYFMINLQAVATAGASGNCVGAAERKNFYFPLAKKVSDIFKKNKKKKTRELGVTIGDAMNDARGNLARYCKG